MLIKVHCKSPRSKSGVKRKKIDKDKIEIAIKFICEEKMTISEASRHFGLKKTTLIYHINQLRQSGNTSYSYCPKKSKKMLKRCSAMKRSFY